MINFTIEHNINKYIFIIQAQVTLVTKNMLFLLFFSFIGTLICMGYVRCILYVEFYVDFAENRKHEKLADLITAKYVRCQSKSLKVNGDVCEFGKRYSTI